MQSQKIFLVLFFNIAKLLLGFLFFYFTALFYLPDTIGEIQTAISFVAIFSFIFDLGFSIAHLKIYPEEKDKEACIGTLFFFKGIFILFSIAFYLILVFLLDIRGDSLIVIIIFIFEIIAQSINTVFSNILIAKNEIIKEAFSWFILGISRISIILIDRFIYPTNAIVLASIYIITTLFRTGFLFIWTKSFKFKKPTKTLMKKYLKYTYPLLISTIVLKISENIGIIFTSIWISNEAVGFYYAGLQFTIFRFILPMLISAVFLPLFSKNLAEDKERENHEIIGLICKYSCMIYIPIILLSFLYSDELIILLLGERYEPSIFIFNFIVLANLLYINDIAAYTHLNARGLTSIFSIIRIFGESINIVLTIFFISPMGLNLGINGLALAIFFRYLISTPIIRYFLWKKYDYPYFFGIFHQFGIALLIYVMNLLLFNEIDLSKNLIMIPILAGLNILIYGGLLLITKGISRKDIKQFRSFVNIKQLSSIFMEDIGLKKEKTNSFKEEV